MDYQAIWSLNASFSLKNTSMQEQSMDTHDEAEIEVRGTLAYLNALKALESGDLEHARDYLQQALQFGLDDELNARVRLAEVYFRLEPRREGVLATEKLLQTTPAIFADPEVRGSLFPHLDVAWTEMGVKYRQLAGAQEALEFFETKLPLIAPVPGAHLPCFHMELGNVYFDLRRYADAADTWKQCIAAEIPYPSGHPVQQKLEEIKAKARSRLAKLREFGIGRSGPCWISSAAYTPDSPVTTTLQLFRDVVLVTHPLGVRFIAFYNRTSPVIADRMRASPALRLTLRILVVLPAYWAARLALCAPKLKSLIRTNRL
jgi:tetratricopeptide (TPR) repeat protein